MRSISCSRGVPNVASSSQFGHQALDITEVYVRPFPDARSTGFASSWKVW
jgi:hypothetical protein